MSRDFAFVDCFGCTISFDIHLVSVVDVFSAHRMVLLVLECVTIVLMDDCGLAAHSPRDARWPPCCAVLCCAVLARLSYTDTLRKTTLSGQTGVSFACRPPVLAGRRPPWHVPTECQSPNRTMAFHSFVTRQVPDFKLIPNALFTIRCAGNAFDSARAFFELSLLSLRLISRSFVCPGARTHARTNGRLIRGSHNKTAVVGKEERPFIV